MEETRDEKVVLTTGSEILLQVEKRADRKRRREQADVERRVAHMTPLMSLEEYMQMYPNDPQKWESQQDVLFMILRRSWSNLTADEIAVHFAAFYKRDTPLEWRAKVGMVISPFYKGGFIQSTETRDGLFFNSPMAAYSMDRYPSKEELDTFFVREEFRKSEICRVFHLLQRKGLILDKEYDPQSTGEIAFDLVNAYGPLIEEMEYLRQENARLKGNCPPPITDETIN